MDDRINNGNSFCNVLRIKQRGHESPAMTGGNQK